MITSDSNQIAADAASGLFDVPLRPDNRSFPSADSDSSNSVSTAQDLRSEGEERLSPLPFQYAHAQRICSLPTAASMQVVRSDLPMVPTADSLSLLPPLPPPLSSILKVHHLRKHPIRAQFRPITSIAARMTIKRDQELLQELQ